MDASGLTLERAVPRLLRQWRAQRVRLRRGFAWALVFVAIAVAALGVHSLSHRCAGAEASKQPCDAPIDDRAILMLEIIGIGVAAALRVIIAPDDT